MLNAPTAFKICGAVQKLKKNLYKKFLLHEKYVDRFLKEHHIYLTFICLLM